jgi:hypothetical protein
VTNFTTHSNPASAIALSTQNLPSGTFGLLSRFHGGAVKQERK